MERRPGVQFGLVGGFHTLFAIPPGAAAVVIGPNFGGADGSHEKIVNQFVGKCVNLSYLHYNNYVSTKP
jgi:hypothetical protein